jgi:hypothetical protein
MSRKIVKIEIRQKKYARNVMTGASTEVLVDGKKLKGVTKATFEVSARGIAKVQLEMLGDITVSGKLAKSALGKFTTIVKGKK